MNKQVLLRTLASKGYKGKPTLEDVRTYLESEGFDTKNVSVGDGKTETLDAIWAKTVHLMCDAGEQVKMHDPPEGEGEAEGQPEAPAAPATPQKSATPSQNYRPGIGWINGIGKVDGKSADVRDKRSVAKKAYDLKAKRGGTIYPDADSAEVAGAWMRSTVAKAGQRDYAQRDLDLDICEKANVESINTDGGVLVPDEFMSQLVWLTEQYGVARKVANVVPMNRDVLTVPRKTGIVSMSPIGEGATITDTSNTFDGVQLVAKKWGALVKITNELLEDSAVNIADDYSRTFAEAQAKAEDDAYFIGDGSATYNGCVGLTSGLVSGAYVSATGSGWSAMLLSDFLTSSVGVVENVNTSRLAFICSRQFYFQVMVKLLTIGSSSGYIGGGNTTEIKVPPGMGQADASFLGYPVYWAQSAIRATAGSEARSVYFGDFVGGTMLGDRRQMAITTSDQRYFDSDYFAIRAISRFTVNIHGDGRGTTYGPIVCLTST